MKRANELTAASKNFDELISKFSDNEILNLQEMSNVRGGEGDGGGDIIVIPKPTKP